MQSIERFETKDHTYVLSKRELLAIVYYVTLFLGVLSTAVIYNLIIKATTRA